MGVIFVTGLPIRDIVGELRNGLGSLAWAIAAGASLLGGQSQWLAIRPAMVALGLAALRLWPVLLYAYVATFAVPVVVFYYLVANATARVLGFDIRPFPPRWAMRSVRVSVFLVSLPFVLPKRLLRCQRTREKSDI